MKTVFETDATMRGMLDPGSRKAYAMAGRATITVQNPKTQTRFTYRIEKSDGERPVYFVALLNGPDNAGDYQYLGTIFPNGFRLTKASKIKEGAPSYLAFQWLEKNWEDPRVAVWHEGACGRCGRKLTVPESIATGLGPYCAGVSGVTMQKQSPKSVQNPVSITALAKQLELTAQRHGMPLADNGLWSSDKPNHYATESSTLFGNNDLRCPRCKTLLDVEVLHSNVEKDEEGDILEWTSQHACGAKLTVFND